MDIQINGHTDRLMGGRTDGYIKKQMARWEDLQTDKWRCGRTDRQMGEQMDRWIDGVVNVKTNVQIER